MEVQIFFNDSNYQYDGNGDVCLVKGECFVNNVLHEEESLCKEILNNEQIRDLLPLSGNFSYVKIKDKTVSLVVDHIRSFPLFYSIANNNLFVSDSAAWIKNKLKSCSLDEIAVLEMKLSGFVLGGNTLYKEIKQVQAGEEVSFNLQQTKLEPQQHRFFEYFPSHYKENSLDQYADEHQKILSEVFYKITNKHKGKKLVVPLSGGLDSRLIVSELKKQGYSDVICFSYGKPDNKESQVSKRIADQLGYKWIFVEYTRSLWREAYNSESFQEYLYSASNYCSLPHIQDWLCIWKLKQENRIPDDSIILPGHTGDFLATGHIPEKLEDYSNLDVFLDEMIEKHFRVNKFSRLNKQQRKRIEKRILDVIPSERRTASTPINKELFQYFDWQERQAKFIVNSIRVYDYFGYKWEIPLWDIELIKFWKNIPFPIKKRKFLYKHCLFKFDQLQLFPELSKNAANLVAQKKGNGMKEKLKRIKRYLLRQKLFLKKRIFYYYQHPLQWYGMFSYFKVITTRSRIQNINTLLVNEYLNKIKNG